MAAKYLALVILHVFAVLVHNYHSPIRKRSCNNSLMFLGSNNGDVWSFQKLVQHRHGLRFDRRILPRCHGVRLPLFKWVKHGYVSLSSPQRSIQINLMICGDIESNPGYSSKDTGNSPVVFRCSIHRRSCRPFAEGTASTLCRVYTRKDLYALRPKACLPGMDTLYSLKLNGILRYRGKRGGCKKNMINRSLITNFNPIPVIYGRRCVESTFTIFSTKQAPRHLVEVPRTHQLFTSSCSNSCYAVPKCLFTNVCSLVKIKNRVKAVTVLESDLHSGDIDVCVVSETHLKPDIPEAIVGIPNYTIYRRDRNCFGNDPRRNGGVAIYVRNNLRVVNVSRSDQFECINITLELPSLHKMLICAIYHPPKAKY